MNKIDYEIFNQILYDNVLKEGSGMGDMAQYEPLIMPIITKLYPQTLVSQIADVQPMSGPVGRIAALFTVYTGNGNQINNRIDMVGWTGTRNVWYETSRIIAVPGDFGTVPSGTVLTTSTGGSFTVLYAEKVAVEMQSLHPNVGDTLGLVDAGLTLADGPYDFVTSDHTFMLVTDWDGTTTLNASTVNELAGTPGVEMILLNRTAIKKYFGKYTGTFGEDNTNVRQISYDMRSIIIEAKTRKVITGLPLEKIIDLKATYGLRYNDVVSDIIAHEIRMEIDMEVIAYLKMIAKPMNDVQLTYTMAFKESGLPDVSADIVASIHMAVEDIIRTTRRNRTMFILGDSATIGFLKLHPLMVVETENKGNPYCVGTLGTYPLYVDMYSSDNYIMVGYKFDSPAPGDAGLIFCPYTHTVFEAEKLGQRNVMSMNRYAYTRHPQDTGTGVGDSDFFRIFHVKMWGTTPFTMAGSWDIPGLTKQLVRYL
jgi:hypothetical protein